MPRLIEFVGRAQRVSGSLFGLPLWARMALAILAVPGLVCVALSIVAFFVSLFALLLLTAPGYRLLSIVTGAGRVRAKSESSATATAGFQGLQELFSPVPPRRHVDVKVVEARHESGPGAEPSPQGE